MGRDDCADLAGVLAGWDGRFSVLVRKRVARHIEGCVVCEETKQRFAVLPMISAAPAFAAPVELRRTVLERAAQRASTPSVPYGFEAPGGFPDVPRRHSRVIVRAPIHPRPLGRVQIRSDPGPRPLTTQRSWRPQQ